MAVDTLVLIANPGSASRKYALYKNDECLASLHFEYEANDLICTILIGAKSKKVHPPIESLEDCSQQILSVLKEADIKFKKEEIYCIGLRIVAPGNYFLQDRMLEETTLSKLNDLKQIVPLHVESSLAEIKALKEHFANVPIVAVSDSAFHADKPDYVWNYGLPLEDAEKLQIKRFGYHGLSVSSIVRTLKNINKLPQKLIVCHLGSGVSITAVKDGKAVETTMGYSPLEGLIMSTRSGSLDIIAALTLQKELGLSAADLEEYLNKKSGLLGVSGLSSDIRELAKAEANGHERAKLALKMFVYHVQQAIGQMAAVLDGTEALVFTGAIGSRSSFLRKRIIDGLSFLGLSVNSDKNQEIVDPLEPAAINLTNRTKLVYVITTHESYEIALRAFQLVYKNQENK